jgi:hypothetical protein
MEVPDIGSVAVLHLLSVLSPFALVGIGPVTVAVDGHTTYRFCSCLEQLERHNNSKRRRNMGMGHSELGSGLADPQVISLHHLQHPSLFFIVASYV